MEVNKKVVESIYSSVEEYLDNEYQKVIMNRKLGAKYRRQKNYIIHLCRLSVIATVNPSKEAIMEVINGIFNYNNLFGDGEEWLIRE